MNRNIKGKIRRATAADCRAVYSLVCDMEEKALHYDDFSRIYACQLADDAYTCIVYEDDDRVKGTINLRMEQQLHHAAAVCEIMELAVDNSCRSRGIGKILFQAACDEARRRGCVQIEVCCNRLRLRAHRFYEACGMHNFHYKFSLDFANPESADNRIGR